jgi:[ribosomal protein S5]-alanine N-acetyltransferase
LTLTTHQTRGASAVLKSKRLVLRPLTQQDAPRVSALAGDWAVASMTARVPYPYSEREAVQWIDGLGDNEFVRGVELNGVLIGAVGYFSSSSGETEIGYWIGKPWWGRGFATEAANALVRYCFRDAGINLLECSHFVDNQASQRVIEKLGFKATGSCLAYCEARNAEIPTRRYVLKRPFLARFWSRAA